MESRLNLQLCLRELMRQVDVNLLSVLRANSVNNINVHTDIHMRRSDLMCLLLHQLHLLHRHLLLRPLLWYHQFHHLLHPIYSSRLEDLCVELIPTKIQIVMCVLETSTMPLQWNEAIQPTMDIDVE